MSVSVRPLTADEQRQLVAARLMAVENAPYLAHALFSVAANAAVGLGTFAVDRGWRLYLDPVTLAGWGPALSAGALVHEISHVVRAHPERADALGAPYDHDRWNIACFPPGTFLPNGARIEDVAKMRRQFDGDLVTVSTQAGDIEATPEHPFWTRRRRYGLRVQPHVLTDAEWISAAELREGDFICAPRLTEKVTDRVIDLRGHVAQGRDGLGRATFANHVVKSIPLNAETAWLIGLYVAEGSASPGVTFSLGSHETELADRAQRILSAIGFSASRSLNGTRMHLTTGAIVFGRWLKEHCGSNAHHKHAPMAILRHADPEIRRAFLEGLTDGDGHRGRSGNRKRLIIATSSQALMHDLVLLLAQDGLGCYTRICAQRPRTLLGAHMPDGMLYAVIWNPEAPSVTPRTLNGNTFLSRSEHWRSDCDGIWYPIKRLSARPYHGAVFNLSTESHKYVAGGYLVHNCDAAINDDLLAARIQLPRGAVTPASLGLEEGGIEETYYAQLAERQIPAIAAVLGSQDGEGIAPDAGAGCGSGAGGPIEAWELPSDDPASPAVGQADAGMTRRRVAQAVREYVANHSRGTLPEGWQRWADATLTGPQVPWRRVLASAVRRAIAHVAGCNDYTYRRPGRRRIPHIVTPAMQRPLITVAVIVDTSGSMGQRELDAALAEVTGVIRAAGIGPRGLLVLACDAAVGATTRVRRVSDVPLVGGGATDMRVGIAAAESAHPRPDIVVVLTDGYTPWPDKPTRARLVVAIIGDQGAVRQVPDWASTVVVPAA